MRYVVVLLGIIYFIIKDKKAMHMLQQNLYNENNRYVKWMKKNSKESIFCYDYINVFLFLIALIVKQSIFTTCIYILVCFIYLVLSITLLGDYNEEKKQMKHDLVITARVKRLMITTTVLLLIPIILLFIFKNVSLVFILIFALLISLGYPLLLLSNFINKPIEKCVYHYYLSLANKKLKAMNQLKIVGITGSYGKTSCKNILSDILNIKYNALPTPKNLNTNYGLMITINNHLSKFDDVFIAEMGAYKRGEIKSLCDMVHPKYGILTTIGTAHLESFGSEENIQKGKFELIESLPSDGIGVLNKDDPKQVNYKLKNKCKILWYGIDNQDADVYACNIKATSKGSVFDVYFKGDEKKYTFETKLLGKHNVYNILSALALGYAFGISIDNLKKAVKQVRPIEHRLELKKLGNFYQIDDAYNSNPIGAKRALEVLSMMDGDKVVVTPGMIELGEKEEEYNREFGKQISTISKANYVILVGKKKTKPIYEGLLLNGFKEENVILTNDVKEAYTILNGLKGKKDLYALFENDLPDTYNE